MSRIVLEHVTKRFGTVVAVDNLSLEIKSGVFFSLLGPSGCGKTTTMRLVAGLERPDSGRIWIDDRLVFDSSDGTFVPPGRRGLGMVFQNYALWPHMTVAENILFGLKVRRVTSADRRAALERVARRLQIEELLDRYPNELSGGQQQRIALARELVTGARVLLMDEPLSNLDAKLRIDMRVELKLLHDESGASIVYVTHDQIEALTLSSHMAVMKSGLLEQMNSPMRVFSDPDSLFVARFMGQNPINELPVAVSSGRMDIRGTSLPFPLTREALPDTLVLASRPEDLSVQEHADDWTLPAVVESVLPMGYESLLRLIIGSSGTDRDQNALRLTVSVNERARHVHENDACFVRFDPAALFFFDPESGVRTR